MKTTTFANGSVETKTYDTMTGDLLDIWTIGAGAATLTRQSTTYDGLGRKAIETLASGATRGFSYDGAGQLTSEVKSGSSGYTANYTYDAAGNRLSKSQGGATDTYTYDAANKLVSVAGVSVSKAYAYDAAGNVVAVTTGTDTTNLTWDGQGRLSEIAYPAGTSNTFAYNGLGQRVGKADSGGSFSYTLADDAIDSNVLADGQATYQYGAGLVSEVRGGTSKVYHADSLGTTRAMSDASGTATDTLETDAFGNTTSSTGSTPSPFGFAGQHGYQSDVDSGLMKLGYRYYDASVGRFLSRDPIQAGYNWYTYCNNDPVNGVDSDGLDTIWISYDPGKQGGLDTGKHIRVYIPTSSKGGDWYGLWQDGLHTGDEPIQGNPVLPIEIPHENMPKVTAKLREVMAKGDYNVREQNCSNFVNDIINAGRPPSSNGDDDTLNGKDGSEHGTSTPKQVYEAILGDKGITKGPEQKYPRNPRQPGRRGSSPTK